MDQPLADIDELSWYIDADFDFKGKDSCNEFFCEIYMSDSKDPKPHQTLEQMRREGKGKLSSDAGQMLLCLRLTYARSPIVL